MNNGLINNMSLSKLTGILLCVFLFVWGYYFYPSGNILSWDVMGYYLYLPMQFIYHDLGIHDFSIIENIIAKYHNTGTFYQAFVSPTGEYVMRYPIGESILFLPFFFMGHIFALLTDYDADGFSLPYQISIWMGCMLYTFIGIFALRKVLLNFFDEKITSFVLVIIVLGTNYLVHSVSHGQGAMPHNLLFTLYAIMLLLNIKWHKSFDLKHGILLSIVLGLICIIRLSEFLVILIPVFWNVYNKKSLFDKLNMIKTKMNQILFMIITFLGVISIQLIYWKLYAGSFIFDSYYDPGLGLDFLSPHTLKAMFSFRNGWLIYTPVMIFSLIGFWNLYNKNRNIFLAILIFFILNLWVITSWTLWWGASSFGQRFLIQSYPVMSIPMGYFLVWIRLKRIFVGVLIYTIILFFIGLNIFQSWQKLNWILITERATFKHWLQVFGKTSPVKDAENYLYMEWPTSGEEVFTNIEKYKKTKVFKLGFEPEDNFQREKLNFENFHSGKSSYIYDSLTEFGPPLEKTYSEITDKYHAWIRIGVWIYPLSDFNQHSPNLVATFIHDGKAYKYKAVNLKKFNIELNKWNFISYDYLTPEVVRNEKDKLAVYIWNNEKANFLIDDLEITIYEPNFYPFKLE